jgi:hypothetical protein
MIVKVMVALKLYMEVPGAAEEAAEEVADADAEEDAVEDADAIETLSVTGARKQDIPSTNAT